MIDAVLATEDARFYEHPGIDPIGIIRAASVWAVSGHARQGASTITQQVARNFFLSNEKTIIRKIKEVFLAWRIEQNLSKDEILELYLNKIPLGYRSFGIGAAAQVYFGKEVKDLGLDEIAIIAGLPKAPLHAQPHPLPPNAPLLAATLCWAGCWRPARSPRPSLTKRPKCRSRPVFTAPK